MLPKINFPTYSVNLLSDGKQIEFRPFLVKEQKLLLIATEAEDVKTVTSTMRQIIKNCIITSDIDIDKLPIFDLEYIFLNLRARSVGEVVNLQYKCNNKTKNEKGEEVDCSGVEKFDINLLSVQPKKFDSHNKKIMLTEKLGLVLKYPTIEMIENVEQSENTSETIINMIIDCIDYIFDENQMYYAKDTSKQELVEFIESLQQKDLDKIKEFFDTSPKITHSLDFKCGKCGYEENITVEGVQNFFV